MAYNREADLLLGSPTEGLQALIEYSYEVVLFALAALIHVAESTVMTVS